VEPMKSRAPVDRRSQERRHHADRRHRRLEALQLELDPLRDILADHSEKLRQLEDEQRVQLVRIAQIQRELDDLKKSVPS
jgi:chromosome segregation ATPase